MREIRLYNSDLVALVDDEDFDRVSSMSWYPHFHGRTVYACGNIRHGKGWRGIKMHRLIVPGIPILDHRDGNGLNNQRSNLRACNSSQNGGNKRLHKNSTSGYKGVCWHSRDKVWNAYIRFQYRQMSLGYYGDPVSAAKAYDAAARKYFGEFAKTNFKGEEDEQLAA